MDKDTFFDNIFVKYPTKYIPLMPLGLWWDTNRGLEKFYQANNITDDDEDIKNTMRHITGLARTTQAYGEPVARMLGEVKETADFWSGNQDNAIDFKNNDLGINFVKQYPSATREEIMQFALQKALQGKNSNLSNILAE